MLVRKCIYLSRHDLKPLSDGIHCRCWTANHIQTREFGSGRSETHSSRVIPSHCQTIQPALRCLSRHSSLPAAALSSFGLLVDIDGVIFRGARTIPGTVEGFKRLSDGRGNLVRPVVFLTNGSARSEAAKAAELSEKLGVNINGSQIILVNTPLRMFTDWHDESVFFAGQGADLPDVAKDLGFKHPVTLTDVLRDIPMFDVMCHARRAALECGVLPNPLPSYFPIRRIIVANTPVNWDAHVQFLLDLLLSNGTLRSDNYSTSQTTLTPQIPIIACNPDLVWASEYHMPRIACGAFMHALSSLYHEMSGRELLVTWCGKPTHVTYEYALRALTHQAKSLGVELGTVFGIGDNVDVDVVGANDNGVVSVLVCSGLYRGETFLPGQRKEGTREGGVERKETWDGGVKRRVTVRSKRASVREGIQVEILSKDIGTFIDWLVCGETEH